MVAAIALRDDYDGARLRTLAKASKDANQTRRLSWLGPSVSIARQAREVCTRV